MKSNPQFNLKLKRNAAEEEGWSYGLINNITSFLGGREHLLAQVAVHSFKWF